MFQSKLTLIYSLTASSPIKISVTLSSLKEDKQNKKKSKFLANKGEKYKTQDIGTINFI